MVVNTGLTALQWKPHNVITLGQTENDDINQMIIITEDAVWVYEKYDSWQHSVPTFETNEISGC